MLKSIGVIVQAKAEDVDLHSPAFMSDNLIDFTDPTPVVSSCQTHPESSWSQMLFSQFRKPIVDHQGAPPSSWRQSFTTLNPWCELEFLCWLTATEYFGLFSSYPRCSSPNLPSHPAGSFLRPLWVIRLCVYRPNFSPALAVAIPITLKKHVCVSVRGFCTCIWLCSCSCVVQNLLTRCTCSG